jgi:very-short-patch-repair endonuclease
MPERWRAIRRLYKAFQEGVDAGVYDWMDFRDHYIADWVGVMTPIECAIWSDIRGMSLPLWPQLPVGRYFVDFGNPVRRVAVECDSVRWHDPERDQKRDDVLNEIGWRVIRVTGRDCFNENGTEAIRLARAYLYPDGEWRTQ